MRLHKSTIVPPTPSTCIVPFVVLTLYAHRCVKGSSRMPTGRNRWRAPVPPTSFWRRSSRSLGSPGNGKEWSKQSINGPWKRSVFAVCRSLHCLFEDRSRPVFVSTETNYAVRSVRSVYAVCTRPVQTGFVPSETNCPLRLFRAVGAVCPISLFVSQAERERQELERAREEQEAREAAEQADHRVAITPSTTARK